MVDKVAFRLGKGWIHDAGTIYFYGTTREANEKDERWSIGLRWSNGSWGYWVIDAIVCGLCTLMEHESRIVVAAGMDGTMLISDAEGLHEMAIDDTEDAPNDLRNITAMRAVGEIVFAVGMSRMVYQRSPGSLTWSRIDHGMRLRRGTGEIAGFRAIDGSGCGDGRLLAAGLFGEIWLFENRLWRKLDSPTNVKLEAVRWVGDVVFIAGAAGVILYGQPDALRIFQDPGVKETFWSIEWFQGRLYLATNKGIIYVFEEDRILPLAQSPSMSTGWLHSADGRLLSVGVRDAWIFDGNSWVELPPPGADSEIPFDWDIK